MAITPHPANVEKNLIANLKLALKDITKLGKEPYRHIMNASNFIAHYNQGGFIEYYQHEGLLAGQSGGEAFAQDIIDFEKDNQWRNFSPGQENYEYQMQRKRIYNEVAEAAKVLYPDLQPQYGGGGYGYGW